jgi:hypothetical protein
LIFFQENDHCLNKKSNTVRTSVHEMTEKAKEIIRSLFVIRVYTIYLQINKVYSDCPFND